MNLHSRKANKLQYAYNLNQLTGPTAGVLQHTIYYNLLDLLSTPFMNRHRRQLVHSEC